MARPLRIEFNGGLYHVTSRGDGREAIYLSDGDRGGWLEIFGDVCKRFNWICHAYCLMDNHYHLLIETPDANLSSGMRQLNGVYTQKFNRTHNKVGHVFQGRFKAIVVDKEAYLLELTRYVVLNPVRAHMVKQAADWPWSSYLAYVGQSNKPVWLEVDWVLSQYGNTKQSQIAGFQRFVTAGVGLSSVWEALQGQIYLGGEDFISKMQTLVQQLPTTKEIPMAQIKPKNKKLEEYRSDYPERRDIGMALAYLDGAYTMQAIGEFFGVHYATVSRAVRKYERGNNGGVYDCKT